MNERDTVVEAEMPDQVKEEEEKEQETPRPREGEEGGGGGTTGEHYDFRQPASFERLRLCCTIGYVTLAVCYLALFIFIIATFPKF